MVKHGVLKERIIKMVSQFFPCQERELNDTTIEFSILIKPFKTDSCSFAIEKLKNIDSVRITCIIIPTTKIQQTLKKLSKEEIEYTMGEFDQIYHEQFKTGYQFTKDYASIQNMKFFLIQNLSYQSLLDSIFLNVILVKEVVKFFNDIDAGLKSPEIDPNNSMYK